MTQPPTPEHIAPPATTVELDAAVAPAEAEPDAAVVEAPLDVGASAAPRPVAAVRTGTIVFRIRPYAVVSIDGREIGETPLDPQTVSVGHHKVLLVNPVLGKRVPLDMQVKPGENILKFNFKE